MTFDEPSFAVGLRTLRRTERVRLLDVGERHYEEIDRIEAVASNMRAYERICADISPEHRYTIHAITCAVDGLFGDVRYLICIERTE